MSHFPSTHLVNQFVSGQSEALTGQRLAKIKYKTTAKQAAKFPNICVSIPFIENEVITGNITKLLPYIKGMLENAQDGVIRSLYESSDGMLTGVTDTDIGLDACISYMDAEAQGSRLTKELISAWFETSVKDYLYVIIAEKLKYGTDTEHTPEQEATIGRHINGYRGLYESLAGGKTVLQDAQIRSLGKVLELIDSDDISVKLSSRLVAMMNKPKIEELLEL